MAILGILARSELAKIVTWVQSMLQTWFWCLSPGFWTWAIIWNHFQTPQSDLSCLNGHLWPKWGGGANHPLNRNFGTKSATDFILVSILRFLAIENHFGPLSDTSDWPELPKWPFVGDTLNRNFGLKCYRFDFQTVQFSNCPIIYLSNCPAV